MARSNSTLHATVALGLLALTLALAGTAHAQTPIPINIESTPPGATVYVDSTQTPPIGTTPLSNARVPRGGHTLIFQLANHEEGRLPVNVARRRETFRIVLNPLGTLVISAGNEGANNATIRVDGQPVGSIPYRATVQPGRHLIQVGREGFVTFSQWTEVAGGQVMTLPVLLEREAPQTGSIMVSADTSGVAIYLDGDPRGSTPTIIENVPAGQHTIELRPDGGERQSQDVRVIAGERAQVNVTLRAAPARTGSLRVLANVPGSVISLDGTTLGEAPVSADSVAPGEHILEATAPGYQAAQQPVTIESGQQRVVSIRLERDPREAGDIVVRADVGSAVITVDGEERGNPPVVVDSPPVGTHAVVVRAEGYEDFRTTCETAPGRNCELTARLHPRGTAVRVVANARDAALFVDGAEVGPIPYEGTIPVGQHHLEVRAEGYHEHVEQVNLVASDTTREFNVSMVAEGEMTEEERAERREVLERERTSSVSHGAAVLPPELATLDISVGWPYLAELRLNVGVLDWLQGGFAIRTFGRLTDFELSGKLGARPVQQVSVGFVIRAGGGLGPDGSHTEDESMEAACLQMDAGSGPDCATGPRDGNRHVLDSHSVNSGFLTLEALGTLHFAEAGGFTLWLALDLISDRWDFLGSSSDCLVESQFGEQFVYDLSDDAGSACLDDDGLARTDFNYRNPSVCAADPTDPSCRDDTLQDLPTGRQDLGRLRLGGSLDLVLGRNWNLWALLEGILAGEKRRILGDLFGFGNLDTQLYFRLGLTYKF